MVLNFHYNAFSSNVRNSNDRGVGLPPPPPFIQAYFRQGVALQYLGRHADALAAFASGLAQDPKSLQLLVGMVEAAMKSPLRGELERSDGAPGRDRAAFCSFTKHLRPLQLCAFHATEK